MPEHITRYREKKPENPIAEKKKKTSGKQKDTNISHTQTYIHELQETRYMNSLFLPEVDPTHEK